MDTTTLPTHPYTGLTAIGIVGGRPVWPVVGGSQPEGEPEGDADDLDDDAAEEGDGDEGEGDAEPEVDWKAKFEEQQAALEASQAKLARARAQAKALREKQEQSAATATTVPKPPVKAAARPAKATPPAEPEVITVQDDSEIQRWQEKAVRADAKSALIGRGCDPDLIDAPLSRLKVAEIDWDGDDPILDEYLDEMEERYPKLFSKPEPVSATPAARPRRAAGIDQGAAAAGRPAQAQKSFGQQLWESGGGVATRRR